MRHVGALAALALVAGCSKPAQQPKPQPSPSYSHPNLAKQGWATIFGEPTLALDLLGRIGLRPGEYRKAEGAYVSEAIPTPMSDPSGPAPAVAHFTARGESTRLTSIRFSLDEPGDAAGPEEVKARQQFERWVRQALDQLGVPGSGAIDKALRGEAPSKGSVAGADYAVTRTTDEEGRHLAVTFATPGAMPAPSDQGTK